MAKINPDNLHEYLSAYLDDELTEARRAELEHLLATDASARAELEAVKKTVKLVSSLPRRRAPAHLLDDLTAQVERQLLVDDEAVSLPKRGYRRSVISLLASAALVTITVGGGLWVFFEIGEQTTQPRPFPQVARMDSDEDRSTLKAMSRRPEPELEQAKGRRKDASAPDDRAEYEAGLDAVTEVSHSRGRALKPSAVDAATAKKEALADGERYDRSSGGALPQRAAMPALLKEKLAAGAPMSDFVRHRFDSESVVLDLTFSGPPDRHAAFDRLTTFLNQRAIPELREYAIMHFVGVGPAVGEDTKFFIFGRSPDNYTDPRQQQLLVRLPAGDVLPMMEAVVGAPSDRSDVSVAVGPARAQGRDEARQLLAYVQGDAWESGEGMAWSLSPGEAPGDDARQLAAGRRADVSQRAPMPAPDRAKRTIASEEVSLGGQRGAPTSESSAALGESRAEPPELGVRMIGVAGEQRPTTQPFDALRGSVSRPSPATPQRAAPAVEGVPTGDAPGPPDQASSLVTVVIRLLTAPPGETSTPSTAPAGVGIPARQPPFTQPADR
ncbi:MAG: hypothetical protein JSV19_00460 [Phycisphaerales bacterium]|nr:MAG: hypothetical protein JSV19_00460 [Phycisphaerales bacterium]